MITIHIHFTMEDIEYGVECKKQEYNTQTSEYHDYREIVIEISKCCHWKF